MGKISRELLNRPDRIFFIVTHLTAITAFSIYAKISHSISDAFDLHCISIVYRAQHVREQTQILRWFKEKHMKWRGMNTKSSKDVLTTNSDHFRCLHVVQANYTNPGQFATLTDRVNLHKAYWLVFVNYDMEIFFKNSNMPFSLVMLAAQLVNITHAEIYELHRVGRTRPVRIHFLGYWIDGHGFTVKQKYVYKRRSNLEGIVLRVGMIQNWPISYEVANNTWMGFFPSVWQQIEEYTNCTSLKIKNESTGSKRKDNEWTGLIGMALNQKIDVIVSELTLDVNRIRVLDFSQPLLKARYQIFFKQPGYVLDWVAVFRPFPLPLWEAILIWIFSASLVLFLFQTILRKFKMEPNTMDFSNCLFFTLQSLSQQGRDQVPHSLACRILFFSSYLVSAVVIPAYSASLISSLTQKTPYRPFNSISEMLTDGTFKLLVPNNTAEYDYFSNTNDPTLSRVYVNHVQTVPRTHVMTNVTNAVHTICNQRNYALFGIDSIMSRKIYRDPKNNCDIISMDKPLGTIHLGIALPKSHPLHPVVRYHIGLMIERGVLSRIESATWPLLKKTTTASWTEVHAEEVFQIFTFLACAILLSISFLICEIIFYQKTKKENIIYNRTTTAKKT